MLVWTCRRKSNGSTAAAPGSASQCIGKEHSSQRPSESTSRGLTLSLDLHTDGADLGTTDVFQRMRRQRLLPYGRIDFRCLQASPGVHQNVAKMVTPDAIAPTLDKEHARPTMSVDGSRRSGRNTCMQYTHVFVFEQEWVVVGCGDQSIQRIRPQPSLLYSARRIRHR